MSCSVKCETCEAEISVEKCVFATYTKVIDGKEHVFCCVRCQQKFLEEQETEKSKTH